MRSIKSGIFIFSLLIFASLNAQAQTEKNELRSYTPPPMFGGTSTPLSPPVALPPSTPQVPVVETPAVAPVQEKPVPSVKPKPATKITTPPNDKEQIVKDTPLPIETLRSSEPQKPTKPPTDKEKTPTYKAPPAKKTAYKAAPKPVTPPPVDEEKSSAPVKPKAESAPAVKTVTSPGVNAESLLNHPVTSEDPEPAKALDPMAVPASDVEDGLPLPGSVPAQKKVTDKKSVKTPEKKTDKKSVSKKETDKKDVKKETKKSESKKVETKKQPAKAPAKEAKPPVKTIKEVKKFEDTPKSKPVEKAISKTDLDDKAYNVKGKKTMPKAMPTKVERTELLKSPLPEIENPNIKTLPTPNEKLIDKSLEDRLVEPDLKNIVEAAPDKKLTKKPASPPPVSVTTPVKFPEKVKPQLLSLEFKPEQTDMPSDMKTVIESDILPKLNSDKYSRLQILSYASPAKEGQSSARRISLARGLSIRAYMLTKGVQPSRIDIRALGENTTEKPLDRVDLMIISYK